MSRSVWYITIFTSISYSTHFQILWDEYLNGTFCGDKLNKDIYYKIYCHFSESGNVMPSKFIPFKEH